MEKIVRNFTGQYSITLTDYYLHLKDWYLTAEVETYNWLVENVQNNWTCLEVGGHVGEVSLLLSQLSSHVIAFEPNPVSCQKFRNNVAYAQQQNNYAYLNIELVERPVGQYDGIMTEKLWLAGKDEKFGETVGEFNFLSLDTFARVRKDISWVSLIFIDADGWDYDVLLGADFIINRCHPYVIMEANYALKWRNRSMKDIQNWAELKNYDCKYLDAQCPGNVLLIPILENNNIESVYNSE